MTRIATVVWDDVARKNVLLGYFDANLRGAGQVFFQDNALTGLIILLAVFWGAHSAGNLNVAIGAVVGLLVCTTTAILLNVDRASLQRGLFGLNGILVGVAVPTFLVNHPMMWAYLTIGAAVSTVVTLAVAEVVNTWGVPGSTAPFVFTTWLLLLGAYSFQNLPVAITGRSQALPIVIGAHGHVLLGILSKNISQVYLIENVLTGILFVVAIAVNSRRSAVFAIIGSMTSLGVALLFGVEATEVGKGLYGFSAVLTAIALGAVFQQSSFGATLYAILATIFTVVVQAALDKALSPIGIPALTFPFVLTLWIFLLPRAAMAKTERQAVENTTGRQ